MPMADLSAQLVDLGCSDVQTYLQSGNAVVTCDDKLARTLAIKLSEALATALGNAIHTLVLGASTLDAIIAGNPFPAAAAAPTTLHAFLLDGVMTTDADEQLRALAAGAEKFVFGPSVLYLHAPDGIGRSRLAARVEKRVGVPRPRATGERYSNSRRWPGTLRLVPDTARHVARDNNIPCVLTVLSRVIKEDIRAISGQKCGFRHTAEEQRLIQPDVPRAQRTDDTLVRRRRTRRYKRRSDR